jgi:hypothetical protein
MPVITKEALELLPKQTGMMAHQQARKVNWSGILIAFLLGELLAGLTVNTWMGGLTVWLPLVLPVGFIVLCAVFAEIQYQRAVRRYRPSPPSTAFNLQPPPLPTSPPPLPKA